MKRLLIIISVLVVLVLAISAIAMPWFLSSDIVKERIAGRIEELTGLKTTLRGTPKLSFIPFLGIKLSDVVIASPAGVEGSFGGEPLVSMEALKGNLKLLPAIFGKPELANFKLVRPKFNFKVSRSGKVNWYSRNGAFSQLLSAVTKKDSADNKPTKSLRLGNFEIINGTINYQNDRLGKTEKLTSVNIELAWPDTDSRGEVTGSLVWRGENVNISARINNPMNLLSDGASDILLDIKSNPFIAHFAGNADSKSPSQFLGTADISLPSVRQYLAWTGFDLAPGSTPGELTLSSKLVATSNTMKFQDATFSMDGNTATGFIEMTVSNTSRVGLAGTLAFESLSFEPYIQSLIAVDGNTVPAEIAKLELIDEFDIDLRFSANTATLSKLSLTAVAATVQIRNGDVILDIGEATLFGGMVQTQIQATKKDGIPTGELKLNLVDIELAQLSSLVSPEGVEISGKGSASLTLKSRGKSVSEIIQRLNGNASISATSGRLEGINIAEIAIDGKSEIILDNAKVLSKATNFTKLNMAMHIANGIAIIEDGQLEGQNLLAKIGGKADLWRGSLAMNGRVLLSKSGAPVASDAENITHNIPFFVGGTFSAPLFASDIFSEDSGKGR